MTGYLETCSRSIIKYLLQFLWFEETYIETLSELYNFKSHFRPPESCCNEFNMLCRNFNDAFLRAFPFNVFWQSFISTNLHSLFLKPSIQYLIQYKINSFQHDCFCRALIWVPYPSVFSNLLVLI